MGACALGTCTDPNCHLCRNVGRLPQPQTLMERAGKYAVPNPALKKEKKHPMFERRKRKALTP